MNEKYADYTDHDWDKIIGADWLQILSEDMVYAKKINWDKIRPNWIMLNHPSLCVYVNWEIIERANLIVTWALMQNTQFNKLLELEE